MAADVAPTPADMKAAVLELLPEVDLHTCSIRDFRQKLEQRLQLPVASLEARAQEVQALLTEALQEAMVQKASAAQKSLESDWGAEDASKSKQAYLVTLPHTLEESSC